MGRPRMATISQEFLLPSLSGPVKEMAVEASHINKRVVDGQVKYVVERPKMLCVIAPTQFYVPQEGYTKRFKDFWRKQFWDRFLQNEGCPSHSCVHRRYQKSWEMPTCWHVIVILTYFNMCCILKPSEAPYMLRSQLALCQWFLGSAPSPSARNLPPHYSPWLHGTVFENIWA